MTSKSHTSDHTQWLPGASQLLELIHRRCVSQSSHTLSSDSGQYTQIVQATVWTSTPTYVVSYISTQVVTLTSYVPCPITTSYTTVYKCSTCGGGSGGGPTTCQPNLCATTIGGVVQPTTTAYGAGDYAVAYVTNNDGVSYTTTVAAAQCTAFASVVFANYDCATLRACGPATTTHPVTTYTTPPTTSYYVTTSEYLEGGQVITYTYTTHGSTIIVVTTLPSRGGPFHLDSGSGSGASRISSEMGPVVALGGLACALVAGVGMLVL